MAGMTTSRGYDDDADDKSWTPLQQKNDEELEFYTDLAVQETQRWIECVTKKPFSYPNDPLHSLSDGVLLCELLNCLKPGCIKRINRLSTAMAKLDNVSLFLEACKSTFGLRVEQLFSVNDLQLVSNDHLSEDPHAAVAAQREEDRRLRSVAITVFWLARQIRSTYHGPDIDFSAFTALVTARPDGAAPGEFSPGGSSSADQDASAVAWRGEGSDSEPRSSDCSFDGTDGRFVAAAGQAQLRRRASNDPLQFVALKPATSLARAAEAMLRKAELAKSVARHDQGVAAPETPSVRAQTGSEDWQGNLSSWKERRRSKSLSAAQSSMDDSFSSPDAEPRIMAKRSSAYLKYPVADDGSSELNGVDSAGSRGVECVGPDSSSDANVPHDGDLAYANESFEHCLDTDTSVTAGVEGGHYNITSLGSGRYKMSFDSFPPANDNFGLVLKGGSDKFEPIAVDSVMPGSPADAAGIEEGDEITEIDSETVNGKTRIYCMTIIGRACRAGGSVTLIVQKQQRQQQQPSLPPQQQLQPTGVSSVKEDDVAATVPVTMAAIQQGQSPFEEYIDDDTGERTVRLRSREEPKSSLSNDTTKPDEEGHSNAQMPVVSIRTSLPTLDGSGAPNGQGRTFTTVTELKLSSSRSPSQTSPPSVAAVNTGAAAGPPSSSASHFIGVGSSKFRTSHDDAEDRQRMEEWARQQEELSQAQFDRDQQLLRKKFEDDQRLAMEAEIRQQQREDDSGGENSLTVGGSRTTGNKSMAQARLDVSSLPDKESRDRAAKRLVELREKYAPTNMSESPAQRRSSHRLVGISASASNGERGELSGDNRLTSDSSIDERERELRKKEDELRRMEERLQQERDRIDRDQEMLHHMRNGRATEDRRPAEAGSKATPSYSDAYRCFEETEPPREFGVRDVDTSQPLARKAVVELNKKPSPAPNNSVSSSSSRHGGSAAAAAATTSVGRRDAVLSSSPGVPPGPSVRRNSFDDVHTGRGRRSSSPPLPGSQEPTSPAVVTKEDVLRATREKARYTSPSPSREVPSKSSAQQQRRDTTVNVAVSATAFAAQPPMQKTASGFDVRDGAERSSLSPASADDSNEVVSKPMDFRSSRAMFEQQCKAAEADWQQRQTEESQRRLQARRKSVGSAAASTALSALRQRRQSPPTTAAVSAATSKPTAARAAKYWTQLPSEAASSGGITPEQLERQRELERLKAAREQEAAAADEGAAREKERRLREERLRELAALRHLNEEYERQKQAEPIVPSAVEHRDSSRRRRSFSGSSSSDNEEVIPRVQPGVNLHPKPSTAVRMLGQDASVPQLPPYESEQIPIMQSEQEMLRLQLERQKELEAMRRSREEHSGQDEALEEIRRLQQQKALQLQRLERLKEASVSQQQPIVEASGASRGSASPRGGSLHPAPPQGPYGPYHAAQNGVNRPLAVSHGAAAVTGTSLQQQPHWRPAEEGFGPRSFGSSDQLWRQEDARRTAELEYQQRHLEGSRRTAEQQQAEEARRLAGLERQQQQQWADDARRTAELDRERWAEESRRTEEARRVSELEQQRRAEEVRRATDIEQQRRAEEARRIAELEQQRRAEEARRAAELEQQRRAEDARRAAELEQQRRAEQLRQEEQQWREEQQRRTEEARRAAELEQQRRAEDARRAAELEQQRRAEDARRAAELEQQRRAEEARRAAELEQQRRAEEARRVAELEQQRRAEEARRAAELEQQRRAEEARRAAELEQQRRAEEARRAAELEQQRRAEEARRAAELEQQHRAEEARRLAELDHHRRAEEARRAAELEQQRQMEEARRIAELERQQQEQQQLLLRRQEEARRLAVGEPLVSRGHRPGDGWPMQPEPQWRQPSSHELRHVPYGSTPELSGPTAASRGLPNFFTAGQKPTGDAPSAPIASASAAPRPEQEYAYINRRGVGSGDRPQLQGPIIGEGLSFDRYYSGGIGTADWTASPGQQQQPQQALLLQQHGPGSGGRTTGSGNLSDSSLVGNANYAAYGPQLSSAGMPDLVRPSGDAAAAGGRPSVSARPTWQSRSLLDDDMVSVSAKQHCAYCSKELGKGAAMVIETLSLYFHVDCFICCVCHSRLSNGTTGADVRVRGNKLHCKNCYSNDEAGVKYSAV